MGTGAVSTLLEILALHYATLENRVDVIVSTLLEILAAPRRVGEVVCTKRRVSTLLEILVTAHLKVGSAHDAVMFQPFLRF